MQAENKMATPICQHSKSLCRQKTRWRHQFVNISIQVGRIQDGDTNLSTLVYRQAENKMATPVCQHQYICRQKTRWRHQFVSISIQVDRKQDGDTNLSALVYRQAENKMVTPVCQHSKSNTGTRKNQPTGLDYYHIQANLASTTIFFLIQT